MAIEPIKGFYVHDEATDTDGVAKYDYGELANLPFGDNVTKVSFKTRPGYISSGGGYAPVDATSLEVYTNKLPCFPEDKVYLSFEWSNTSAAKWVSVAYFDENGKFISRSSSLYNGYGPTFSTTINIPANAYYYAVTWRTYGDCIANFMYKGSLLKIQERVPKGLPSEPIAGGFDTTVISTNIAENFGGDVLLFGNSPITDFVPLGVESYVLVTLDRTNLQTSYMALWFDGNREFLSSTSWANAERYFFAPPSGAKYVRFTFAANTSADYIDNIKSYFSYEVTSIGEDTLTPIICGSNYPALNTVNKTFTIPYDCIFFKDRNPVLPSSLMEETGATVLDLPTQTQGASSAQRLYFDLDANVYRWIPYSTTFNKFERYVLVAVFRMSDNFYSVSIACPYQIDGKLYGINASSSVDFGTIAWAFNGNVKGVNHRGYSTAPENTLLAYKSSKQNGFSYVETDVSYTSDEVAVLLHDSTINRTARNEDGAEISGDIAINTITYEQALQYDFGIYKGAQYAGTQIPTFEQFIALCKNIGLHPYIELKAGTETQTRGLVDIVKRYGMDGRVTWISFSSTLLTWVKNYDPAARIGFVTNDIDSSTITTAQGLKTSTNEVFIDASWTVTDEKINLCVDANIPLEVWTVDRASVIEALNPYISGVTSDNLVAEKVLYDANKD